MPALTDGRMLVFRVDGRDLREVAPLLWRRSGSQWCREAAALPLPEIPLLQLGQPPLDFLQPPEDGAGVLPLVAGDLARGRRLAGEPTPPFGHGPPNGKPEGDPGNESDKERGRNTGEEIARQRQSVF